jgi:TRAP-type C4-dicarboxylate transport system permease small subunit
MPDEHFTEAKKRILWVVSFGFLAIFGFACLQSAYSLSDPSYKIIMATVGLICVFVGVIALLFLFRKYRQLSH